MKVDPNLQSVANLSSDAVQNGKTTRAQGSASETSADSSQLGGSDTVQFSSKFAEAQHLTAKVQELPDVRSERVAMLRAKIQQGTYKPDPSAIANAILNDPLNKGGK
jgi:negative regulator of flagellin synthesis FlgM